MDLATMLARLTDTEILGLTGWAEARGDIDQTTHSSLVERVAVMCAVRNRRSNPTAYRAATDTYTAICLAPRQFSCWSVTGGRDNYESLIARVEEFSQSGETSDPVLNETLFLAGGVVSGLIRDVTGGATMYYSPASMVPAGSQPAWAATRTTWLELGSQRFYRL